MTRPAFPLLAVIFGLAAALVVVAVIKTDTHTVTRTPTACTRAALLAEQAQLDWQRILQAHVDVENEASDGTTLHSYRRHLAAIPGPPNAVDLGVCGGSR